MTTMYKVGDVNPTNADEDDICDATSDASSVDYGYYCTWPKGHTHPQHVAGGGKRIFAVWPNEATPIDTKDIVSRLKDIIDLLEKGA